MGNLVFQATLGGQVNLVGPNTASTFNLNVPAVSSTIATLTGTETFTNKTLTTPVISSLSSASATALTLQSAGTTAITIDTSQNVGIGTISPGTQFNVYKSTATAVNIRPQNSLGYADFGPQADGSVYGPYASPAASTQLLVGTSNSNPFTFYTNGAERMRINAGAPILCLAGGSTTATGTGIAFPATQSASSDANTLDDYEEGTWTPTLKFGGATTGITYTFQNGLYTKVGNLVFIRVTIVLTSKGSATGVAQITGLPFTTISTVGGAGFNVNYFGTSASINGQVFTQSEASTTTIDTRQKTATSISDLTNSNFANDTNFQFSGCYQV